MKRTTVVLLAGFLACCASTQRAYDGPPRDRGEVAVITSQSTAQTETLLAEMFGSTPGIRVAMLESIDGKLGTHKGIPHHYVYNSDWDGSLEIEVLPGTHELIVMPNQFNDVSMPEVTLPFSAFAGHQYYLGQIIQTHGYKYNWQPLLVDQTSGVVVFPERVTWKPQ